MNGVTQQTDRISSGHRFVILDGLRGVAAIIVMLYHFQAGIPRLQFTLGGQPHMFFSLGWLSVDFFFMLSGFVIFHTYQRRFESGLGFKDFMIRRLIRLYPMIAIGFILGFAVLVLKDALGQLPDWGVVGPAATANLFFIPSFNHINFPSFSEDIVSATASGHAFLADPPAWSLFFELLANVTFAWWFRLGIRPVGVIVACSFAMMLGFDIWSFHHSNGGWGINYDAGSVGATFMGGFPRVVFGFWTGVLLYHANASLQKARDGAGLTVPPVVIYAALAIFLSIPFYFKGALPLLFLVAVAPAIILGAARLQGLSDRQVVWAEKLGWLSYPLYCVHWPIGRLVWAIGRPAGVNNVVLFIIASLLALVGAIVLGRYVEQPLRALLTVRYNRRKASR